MKHVFAGFATAAFAVFAMATAPQAVASPDDDFLGALAAGGIPIPSSATSKVIQGGHLVCQGWSSGASYKDVVGGVVKATGGNAHQAGIFISAATNSFCPNYASKLQ